MLNSKMVMKIVYGLKIFVDHTLKGKYFIDQQLKLTDLHKMVDFRKMK